MSGDAQSYVLFLLFLSRCARLVLQFVASFSLACDEKLREIMRNIFLLKDCENEIMYIASASTRWCVFKSLLNHETFAQKRMTK